MAHLFSLFKKLEPVFLAFAITGLLFIGLATFVYRSEEAGFSHFLVWYVSTATAVTILSICYFQNAGLMRLTEAWNVRSYKRLKIDANKLLDTVVRPRIDTCEGLAQVCDMAAGIISTAHKKPHHEQRYVTFYGAASLAIPEGEIEEFGSVGGSGQQSPYQKYLGALDAATGDKIRMRRYVKLFTEVEFSSRSVAIQREYLNWLKGQYNMLSRNPNYIMVNVVRAPAWGSKIARIITHDALMEITGDGDAAFLITDNQTCDTIRRAARETVIGPKNARNEPEYFGHAKICGEKRVEAFKKYFQSIETRFSPKGADEETEG